MINYVKILIKSLIIILISVCIGVGSLTLIYMIPNTTIKKNVEDSLDIFEKEGTYYDLTKWCSSKLNNFTDGHMLLQAIYDGPESALDKALHAYECRYSDQSPDKSLLMSYAEENMDYKVVPTTRYWHGYLVITTPLLTFLNWGQIRQLNLVIQIFIDLLLCVVLIKKNMEKYIFPYILSIFLIMPLTLAYNLASSFVFYIFSIGSIVLISKNDKGGGSDKHYFLFLVLNK